MWQKDFALSVGRTISHAGNLLSLAPAGFAINKLAWPLGVGQLELIVHSPSL